MPVVDNIQSLSPVNLEVQTTEQRTNGASPSESENNSSSPNDSLSPAHSIPSNTSDTLPCIINEPGSEVTDLHTKNTDEEGRERRSSTDNQKSTSIGSSSTSSVGQFGAQPSATQLPFIETVPISSYTSSDEEDDGDEFFDAEEDVTVVDDIENSLKTEEIEAMQRHNSQSTTNQNILDMNDVMKSEERQRTQSNTVRYSFPSFYKEVYSSIVIFITSYVNHSIWLKNKLSNNIKF